MPKFAIIFVLLSALVAISQAGSVSVDERLQALNNLSKPVLEKLTEFLDASTDLPRSEFIEKLEALVDELLAREDISASERTILIDFINYATTTPRFFWAIFVAAAKIAAKEALKFAVKRAIEAAITAAG